MDNNEIEQRQMKTVEQALQYCSKALADSDAFFGHGTDNAWDEAVQLVLFAADLPLNSGAEVLPQHLTRLQTDCVHTLLQRRVAEHVPLPYLLGRAWFAGLEFHCDQRALVPRSPIAELIRGDFKPWYTLPDAARVLDLCCGGGCIGLAVAHYFPTAQVDLVDIDDGALALSRENRDLLHLRNTVNIRQADLFDGLKDAKYDLIVTNPPYVNAADLASMPIEYHREPQLALASGADGLDLVRRILRCAPVFLQDDGALIMEVGNSACDLEKRYPRVPFTWIDFEQGGTGVFVMTAKELQKYSTSWEE